MIETVTHTLHDTIREITTILVQTNNDGDTIRLTANRDREKIISRDRAATTLNHQTTQTETQSTAKESTTTNPILPIQPINPKSPIKPIAIAFIIGLLLFPLIKLIRRLKC